MEDHANPRNPNGAAPQSHRRQIISSFPHYIYKKPTTPAEGSLSAFVTSSEANSCTTSATSSTDIHKFNSTSILRSRNPLHWQHHHQVLPLPPRLQVPHSPSSPSSPRHPLMSHAKMPKKTTMMLSNHQRQDNDGKQPLPLPPRLQTSLSFNTSPPTTSRAPSTKWNLSSLSFKSKDFDPFTTAVENIRKEDMPARHKPSTWRTNSMEPLRSMGTTSKLLDDHMDVDEPKQSRRKKVLEFLIDVKDNVSNTRLASPLKKKRSKDDLVAFQAWHGGRRVAPEKTRCESLMRYRKHPVQRNLTAWFGSARFAPEHGLNKSRYV